MSGLILTIDQGTSGTKTVLFDKKAQIIARGNVESLSLFPQPGFVEQDPVQLYENTLASVNLCIAEAKHSNPEVLNQIDAIGISNQRETFLLWDKKGTPLCNAIIWQCKRSIPVCERLKGTEVEDEIKKRTGLLLDPYFSGAKLAWMIEHSPRVKEAVTSGEAFFGTIDTWLLFKLTAGQSYLTDFTNAARTLLFNIHTLDWDEVLIKAFGAEGIRTPKAVPSSYSFGSSDFGGIFPKPIPITGMIGDSHAAAFGEGCFQPGQAKATLGTGSSILCNIGSSPSTSAHGMVTTICWSMENRLDYALEGIIVTCGATIKWLRDQLGLLSSSAETEAIARSLDDNGGVYLIPAFSGMGAPHWKMDARASIVGLTFGADKNHIIRAALESVAYQVKDVISSMEKDSGIILSELKVDGGMSSNRWLMQMIADLLGVKVVTIGIEEVSALGAAYMAGLEIGIFKDIEKLTSLHDTIDSFNPNPEAAEIVASYNTWRSMINKHC
ncbi:FGGY family carbohydrate kinase [Desulfopila aestuarii]|uniref:ATP:glycerol 3-phosphotransferase n=1 Tax=Desulfopila aestuarii DSM 18488 TaxID=1121416 RepID=A0A1M7XVW7_9BACT|nr:glycerol kinase GlpK [Desulfopila aestuarii]SHO42806.1 glycerol kinase [Desulfopila aestuarii DSM 18488]